MKVDGWWLRCLGCYFDCPALVFHNGRGGISGGWFSFDDYGIKDTATDAFYHILSIGVNGGTASFVRPNTKTKKAKVPAVIYHGGKKYKVTSVAAKAFAGNKKLKSVVIGKNVKKIQKKAFVNCKKLLKVIVKSKVLSKVAKNAFRGTNKKLTVKVPKKKGVKYRKLFKRKGNKILRVK